MVKLEIHVISLNHARIMLLNFYIYSVIPFIRLFR